MKKRTSSHLNRAALAVPMAALMLGAAESRAVTTVGVHIQGSAYGYNAGAAVTQAAFGIGATGWFGTGLTGGDPGYNYGFTSGSMTVIPVTGGPGFGFAWTSGQANHNYNPWCGWNPPDPSNMVGYTGYPGDYQAAYAFLSPAYSLSLTGLNAQFPNGYVIQAIAGLDSGSPQSVTVTGSSTGTLTFTNLCDRSGGGSIHISTASAAFTDNSVTLTPTGDAGRAAISGFIITDKPVVTSCRTTSSSVASGSSFTLTGTALGLGTLTYQWKHDGSNVGTNSPTYTVNTSGPADSGNYTLTVTSNLYPSDPATGPTVPIAVVVPVPVTWDANTGTAGAQDGSGTWNAANTNWWDGAADVAWSPLNPATFGIGGTGAYTVTLGSSITAGGGITFNSGNYTISPAAAETLSLAGTAQITSNANATINATLAGTSGMTKTGTGMLTLSRQVSYTGGTVVNNGKLFLDDPVDNGVIFLSGALTVNSGGTVETKSGTGDGLGWQGQTTAVTINGGTINFPTSGHVWNIPGGITMTGGTLQSNNGVNLAGNAGGATQMEWNKTSVTTLASPQTATLAGRINIRGDNGETGIVFNVADGDAATDLLVSAGIGGGAMAITKNGGGTMALTGTNSYSGGTTINGGTLLVSGQISGKMTVNAGALGLTGTLAGGSTAFIMKDDASLTVTARGATPAITTTSTMTVGTDWQNPGVNSLTFNALTSTTVAPVSVGMLSLYSAVTVNIGSVVPAIGLYPLIKCTSSDIANGLTLNTATLPAYITAAELVDDTANTGFIYLHVTDVYSQPVVVRDPVGITIASGTTLTLTALVGGTEPLVYQWKHDNVDIPDANSATYTKTGASTADSGSYTLEATNGLGTATTTAAAVVVATNMWNVPVTIAGDTDVVTDGTGVFAYDWNSSATTVNTVPFTAPGAGVTLGNLTGGPYNGYLNGTAAPATSLTTEYKDILTGGAYNSGAVATVTLNGLTPGNQYLVQFWVDDSRSGGSRTETLTSGTNTVTLKYPQTVTGALGQYTIGTFIATESTKIITLTPNSSAQINAIQLRDLGVYPVAPMPVFSLPSGNYLGAQSITLTGAGTIYYTTNSSDPTTSSPTYAGPIPVPVDTTVTIKSFATNPPQLDSPIASATYNTFSSPAQPTWTNAAGGSWPTPANWQNGVVGNGSGITADFSTLDLSADATVTLDGSRTVGSLHFADTTPSHKWVVATGSDAEGFLTLAGPTPTITVDNQTTTLSAMLKGTQGFTKSGAGTLVLQGSKNFSGGVTVNQGTLYIDFTGWYANPFGQYNVLTIGSAGTVQTSGTHSLGVDQNNVVINGGHLILGAENYISGLQMTGGTVSGGQLRTFGGTMTFGASTGGAVISTEFSLVGSATLNVANGTAADDLTLSGVVSNANSLTKAGDGLLRLTGVNTYTGDTVVNAGTLAVNGSSIANGGKLVINGGKVEVTGNETVNTLYYSTTQRPPGTYGATGSGAAHIDDARFSGTGMVTVLTGPPGFSEWALANAPGLGISVDHDNDGVSNGIEYFMGETGSTFTANPGVMGGVVSWPKGASYVGIYGIDYVVQTSTDLSTWVDVPIGNLTSNGNPVQYTLPTGATSIFTRLKVTGP